MSDQPKDDTPLGDTPAPADESTPAPAPTSDPMLRAIAAELWNINRTLQLINATLIKLSNKIN
jgi:hypothetical protein